MKRITKKLITQGAAVSLSLFVLSSTITPSFANDSANLAVELTEEYTTVTTASANSAERMNATAAETPGTTVTEQEPVEKGQEILAIEVSDDQPSSDVTDDQLAVEVTDDQPATENTDDQLTVEVTDDQPSSESTDDQPSSEVTTTDSDTESVIDDSVETEQQVPAEDSSSVVLEEEGNVSVIMNNDQLTIQIKGLTDAQQEEVLSYIRENVNFSLTDGYIVNIERPFFTDTEKFLAIDYDSLLCWAASAANMLWLSGYAQKAINPKTNMEFQSVDEVFDYFRHSFTDEGGITNAGIQTFLNGHYDFQGYDHFSQLKHEVTGLLPDLSALNYALSVENESDIAFLENLNHYSIGLDIVNYYPELDELSSSHHSITAVGYVKDDTATNIADRYKAIIFADSDSHLGYEEYSEDPEERFRIASTAPRVYSISQLKYVDLGVNIGKRWTMTTLEGSTSYTIIENMSILSDYGYQITPIDPPSNPDQPVTPTKPSAPAPHHKPSNSPTDKKGENGDAVADEKLSTDDKELLMEIKKYDYEQICAQMKEENLFVYSPEEWVYKLADECACDLFVYAPLKSLQKVVLDGEELKLYDEEKHTGDYKIYDFENGVFFVSLNKELMQSLEIGRHSLRIQMMGRDRIDDIIVK